MSIINITNLTFAYEGSYDNIFEDVSFQLDTDWKLGFTGRNGRGKTTLLNLLMGKYDYNGSIHASVEFEYFPFEVTDQTVDTMEVVLSVSTDFELWELQRELSRLEVEEEVLYRRFDTLSNGERAKVLLAALFLKPNRFLLIDEPTNHLDMRAREIVSEYLNSKQGFILVSHDRTFLDRCIDHIISINRTNIEVQRGNFSSWWENKARQDSFEIAENDKLKKDIRRLSHAARRTSGWSDRVEASKIGSHAADRGSIGHKAAKMMKRAKNIEARQQSAIAEKSQLLKNIEESEPLKIAPAAYPAGKMAAMKDVALFYGGRQVCGGISMEIQKGDRIAVCGKNGSGKSSLLKLICGEALSYTGELWRGSGLAISYMPQDTAFLRGGLSEFARAEGIDESLFKAILRKLDFSRTQFEKDLSDFSGGQKKKVLLAKSLCDSAHLYVWDEPLNFIDIFSRMQIEELILRYCPTMVFVEHDRAFSDRVANKVIEL